jgi:uncharacterized membrane protein
MTSDSPMPPTRSARTTASLPLGASALLFVPLTGVLAVVAAILLLVTAPGTLTLTFAILVALAGTFAVIATVNHDLNDSDGETP